MSFFAWSVLKNRTLAHENAVALSLVLPASKFVTGLDAGGYTIWLARIIWVISVPVVFCSILLVILFFRKK